MLWNDVIGFVFTAREFSVLAWFWSLSQFDLVSASPHTRRLFTYSSSLL